MLTVTSSSRRGVALQSEDYARDRPEGATCCIPPGEREEHKRLPTSPWIYARLCRQLVRVQVSHRWRRAPGDAFRCTLGVDPATRIRYTHTSKRADDDGTDRERSAFSEQWATTTYRSCTTITNGHSFALRALVLRDGVPVSEDKKRARIVLRRPEGLAVLEQGDELKVCEGEGQRRTVRWSNVADGKGGKKEGMFEWVAEVGAGEEITIKTEWDVKAPVSLSWVESA